MHSATARGMSTKAGLVWFKSTDLRLRDNPVLTVAHAECSTVTHLYVFDPFWFSSTRHGFQRCAYYRSKFLLESVADLRRVRSRPPPVYDVAARRPSRARPFFPLPSLAELAHKGQHTHRPGWQQR